MSKVNMQVVKESAAKAAFTFTALVSILAVALICVFLLANGIPGMAQIGVWDFLSGEKWKPGQEVFGILPFILGSVYVTAGALVVGVPAGLMTALFLSRFASKRMAKLLRPAVQLLAGIPSVVYGFFGLVVLVPLVRELFGGTGSSLLTASVLLGMMILPTIITVAESALNAVPATYYEGALALGATHERSVFHVILPAAKSGVVAGVILGIGRAIGEATAVMMVAGNRTSMPKGLLKGVRTLTSNIVIEMGYATDLHRDTGNPYSVGKFVIRVDHGIKAVQVLLHIRIVHGGGNGIVLHHPLLLLGQGLPLAGRLLKAHIAIGGYPATMHQNAHAALMPCSVEITECHHIHAGILKIARFLIEHKTLGLIENIHMQVPLVLLRNRIFFSASFVHFSTDNSETQAENYETILDTIKTRFSLVFLAKVSWKTTHALLSMVYCGGLFPFIYVFHHRRAFQ